MIKNKKIKSNCQRDVKYNEIDKRQLGDRIKEKAHLLMKDCCVLIFRQHQAVYVDGLKNALRRHNKIVL